MLKTLSSQLPVILLAAAALFACQSAGVSQSDEASTRLVVLGMIHSGHLESEVYSTEVIRDALRRVQPDVVLAEIPLGRLEGDAEEFRVYRRNLEAAREARS